MISHKMVPVEPTEAMLDAASAADDNCTSMQDEYRAIWSAMLTAAPEAPASQGEIERAVRQAFDAGFTFAEGKWHTGVPWEAYANERRDREVAEIMASLASPPSDATHLEICPQCNGSGVGVADTVCSLCNGSGGVPPSDAQDAATVERLAIPREFLSRIRSGLGHPRYGCTGEQMRLREEIDNLIEATLATPTPPAGDEAVAR